MDDPAVTPRPTCRSSGKHVEDAKPHRSATPTHHDHEQDDDVARLSGARLVRERMQKQLAQMTKAHVAAEEHLSKVTVDETSVEKVVRYRPM